MAGAQITDEQVRRFYYLHLDIDGPRLTLKKAAEQCGFSETTGKRLVGRVRKDVPGWNRPGLQAVKDLPEPRSWNELTVDAQDSLRDIHVFRERYFARRRQVWVYDAAMRILEAIDSDRREFVDLNVFPGAGKTFMCLDVGCWLIAGGGFCDPRRGRAMRLMYGAEVMKVSVQTVKAVRNFLTLRRPYYDIEQDRLAEAVLSKDFGRFRPIRGFDPDTQWTEAMFVVAQVGLDEIYEKEPTVQAASFKSGFLGMRVQAAFWDDLSTTKNSSTAETAEAVDTFVANEAERRIEPGGAFFLVGQRLGPLDIHAKRLAIRRRDGTQLYRHIVYPAHHDRLCDGRHRQWDGTYEPGAGCLTDAWRLPEQDWEAVAESPNYRTVYQQEDVDPDAVLVLPDWLEGGTDPDGYDAPGCYEPTRAFGELPPKEVGRLICYGTVDPSPTKYWAVEWWAYQPESRVNYLVWGERRKMPAGGRHGLLDWDNEQQVHIGLMQEIQTASAVAGAPIRCWVLETNIAQRFLLDYEHYRRWRRVWPDVAVIKHETQMNKLDPTYGVTMLSTRYRTGHKRLPHRASVGFEGRNFMRVLVKELTTYPFGETDDTVMADWMGEYNLPRIVKAAQRTIGHRMLADARLPGYLRRQQHEIPVAVGGIE